MTQAEEQLKNEYYSIIAQDKNSVCPKSGCFIKIGENEDSYFLQGTNCQFWEPKSNCKREIIL